MLDFTGQLRILGAQNFDLGFELLLTIWIRHARNSSPFEVLSLIPRSEPCISLQPDREVNGYDEKPFARK